MKITPVSPPPPALAGVKVALEIQGNLFALAWRGLPRPALHYKQGAHSAKRGKVTTFSRASRLRLLKQFARLRPARVTFITLTYGKPAPAPASAKAHLRALLERIRRRYPRASAIWRAELQKRGAIHFHLVFYGLPYIQQDKLLKVWREITKAPSGVNIKLVRSPKRAMAYVSKYAAKFDHGGAGLVEFFRLILAHRLGLRPAPLSTLFIYAPYLHASRKLGRVWGIFNRPALPLAPRYVAIVAIVVIAEAEAVFDLVRYLRRAAKRPRAPANKGIVVFTDAAKRWQTISAQVLGEEISSFAWLDAAIDIS